MAKAIINTQVFATRYWRKPEPPKPRLYLKHHVWSCRTGTHLVDMCIGYGYTARDAYDDWRRRITMSKPRD